MVNERLGKAPSPRPVYNRKLVRSIIRADVQRKYGNHKVSHNMAVMFEKLRKGLVR